MFRASFKGHRVLLALAAVAAFVPSAFGQGAPDISGLWQVQDPGSGSWSAFWNNVPRAVVRPEITRDNKVFTARELSGDVVNTEKPHPGCPTGSLQGMMGSSGPLMIVLSRDEMTMGSEAGRARFIYLDGRQHPADPSLVAWSGAGHSVGHWEGNTLVVDTVDFPAHVCDSRMPTELVPGGGRSLPTTHLTERYQLLDAGTLSVTFTWDDPTVYLQPQTYTYKYKLIPGAFPMEGGGGGAPPGGPQTGNAPAQTNYGLAHVTPDQVPDEGPFSLPSIP